VIAAAIYLLVTLFSQFVIKRIELRTTRFERSAS
jgi:arginine transport system permease protein